MSFKIFSLQLTGKIKPVATIEKQREALANDYAVFLKTEGSDKLSAFMALKEMVNSDEFKKSKKEIESLRFKGSEEEKQLKEFTRLTKLARIKKFFAVEGSSNLVKYEAEKDGQIMKEYYAHLKYIKEGQFEKDKKEIKSQVFKGSVEDKKLKEFKRLDKSAAIRAYKELVGSDKIKQHKSFEESDKLKQFNELKNKQDKDKAQGKEFKSLKRDAEIKSYLRFNKSKKFKLFNEIKGSDNLKRYNELKEYISSEAFKKRETFLKDKKKFEKSEAYKKQHEFKKLASNVTVKFVLQYEKSKLYKNYLEVKDSSELKRHNELKELIESDEFKKQKAWLEDKKRWEKTEGYKKEQQYQKEKMIPEFINYYKYKDTDDFDFFKNWEVVFEDDFAAKDLNNKLWGSCPPSAEKLLGENYAMPGDIGIFTNGSNLNLDNKLRIQVKKEKTTGKVWQMPAGFVPAEFEYTSGMISSGGRFEMGDGIVEAKIKYKPVKQVASSFYLSGNESTPRANLVEMGAKNNVGISRLDNKGKIINSGLDISNLKRGLYLFTLQKDGATFSWKINETEVWTEREESLNKALQLNASSLLIDSISASSDFEIEWVKCYRKK